MSTHIHSDHFTQALYLLLDEIFDNVHGIYLDEGTSMFETLATISMQEASIPISGKCATLAAARPLRSTSPGRERGPPVIPKLRKTSSSTSSRANSLSVVGMSPLMFLLIKEKNEMQKITPSLWFDKSAEEAMNFYTSTFSNAKIISIKRYPEEVPQEFMKGMEGRVLTGTFELEGHRFMALDGGPLFTFNPSVSFFVNCKTKEEINRLWEVLSEGGETLMPLDKYPFSEWYGWVQDKYRVSWQLILSGEGVEQKIIPSMMFVGDQCGRAEEAIKFYASIFDHSNLVNLVRYEAGSEPQKEGSLMFADFKLDGQLFAAMDSALDHDFTFNEAISFYVECGDQAEVDHFWEKLSAVPEAEQCGWLKDQYGLSWQIVPKQLGEFLSDPDPEKADRAMQAMLQMKKLDIAQLKAAYDG